MMPIIMNMLNKTKKPLPYNTHVYHYCGTVDNKTIDGIVHLKKCVTNMTEYREVKDCILKDMVVTGEMSITSMSYFGQHLVYGMED